MAVYLVYAGRGGHAIIDRELYVPASWTDDRDRCRAAGIPDQIEFATKSALAQTMIGRALDAGVPAAWVAGDEVYGADPGLRAELEARGVGYVLTLACDHRVPVGGVTHRADALVGQVPARAWQQVSCGRGAKAIGCTTGRSSALITTATATAMATRGVMMAATTRATTRRGGTG